MQYTLGLGKISKVKGLPIFNRHGTLVYSGMPNPKVFTITPLRQESPGHGFSPTIFFPKNSKKIMVLDKEFEVIKVTPEEIVLEGD
jgi:hypothetical protein